MSRRFQRRRTTFSAPELSSSAGRWRDGGGGTDSDSSSDGGVIVSGGAAPPWESAPFELRAKRLVRSEKVELVGGAVMTTRRQRRSVLRKLARCGGVPPAEPRPIKRRRLAAWPLRSSTASAEGWRCEWCDCTLGETPRRAKGPNGPDTLCESCGQRRIVLPLVVAAPADPPTSVAGRQQRQQRQPSQLQPPPARAESREAEPPRAEDAACAAAGGGAAALPRPIATEEGEPPLSAEEAAVVGRRLAMKFPGYPPPGRGRRDAWRGVVVGVVQRTTARGGAVLVEWEGGFETTALPLHKVSHGGGVVRERRAARHARLLRARE